MGGSAPHGLKEYYRGGANTPSTISTTVNVAAGAWGSYRYSLSSSPRYYWEVHSVGAFHRINVIYNNITYFISVGSTSQTNGDSGDYNFDRGNFRSSQLASKGNPDSWYWYEVRRRTKATTTTTTTNVNATVPTSGEIAIKDFYGGRKL